MANEIRGDKERTSRQAAGLPLAQGAAQRASLSRATLVLTKGFKDANDEV